MCGIQRRTALRPAPLTQIGPQLLKFVPGKKAADLKHWLTVYSYWNQGGLSNVVSMFLYLIDAYQVGRHDADVHRCTAHGSRPSRARARQST